MPIGTSPAFSDYKIKINPDKLFGKHAAILGNTGSGKSCTLASILQTLFAFEYNGSKLGNAHIVIFDTNGEYRSAFQGTEDAPYKDLQLVNPFHIDKNGMKVPFWFMNFADYDHLFEPTSGTQAPILKRAIGLAKNEEQSIQQGIIPRAFIKWIELVITRSEDISNFWKIRNSNIPDSIAYLEQLEIEDFDQSTLASHLSIIQSLIPAQGTYGDPNLHQLTSAIDGIKQELARYYSLRTIQQVSEEKNVDLPIWFDFEKLLSTHFDQSIDEQETSSSRIREFVSTLKLRMQSYLNDERIAQPLLLSQKDAIEGALAKFIAFILGDFCKVYQETESDLFTTYFQAGGNKGGVESLAINSSSQITIIDMSLLPFEVLETVTGLIGRLILEFVSRFAEEDRGKLPIVLALEEAQNYIPERNNSDKISVAKKVFERIAREGRKYGISLLISSQRPSELSKTVLSQCNSFIIHRLQNPEDQKYVRQLVSAANEDILQQLPILPQQHVIVMGDAVRTPVQAKMNTANPRPNSRNPEFIKNWTEDKGANFPDYIGIAQAWEQGEKYTKPLIEDPAQVTAIKEEAPELLRDSDLGVEEN